MLKIGEEFKKGDTEFQRELKKIKNKSYVFKLKDTPYDEDAKKHRPQKMYIIDNWYVKQNEKTGESDIVRYYKSVRKNNDGDEMYLAENGWPKVIFTNGAKSVDGATDKDLVWWLLNHPDRDRLFVLHDKMDAVRKEADKDRVIFQAKSMIYDEQRGMKMSELRDIARTYGETGVDQLDDEDVRALLSSKITGYKGAQEFINKVNSPYMRVTVDINNALEYGVIKYVKAYRAFAFVNDDGTQDIIKEVPQGISDEVSWFVKFLIDRGQSTLEEIKSRLLKKVTEVQREQNQAELEREREEKEVERVEKETEPVDNRALTMELSDLHRKASEAFNTERYEECIDYCEEALEINRRDTPKQESLHKDFEKYLKKSKNKLETA